MSVMSYGKSVSVVAHDVTSLKEMMDESEVSRLHYSYGGDVFEGVEVNAMLAESLPSRTVGSTRRRMIVLIPDELWLHLAGLVIARNSILRGLGYISQSHLLSTRRYNYERSKYIVSRYSAGKFGNTHESRGLEGYYDLVDLASTDKYPSLTGQPLSIMHNWVFAEQYAAYLQGDTLLLELPDSIITSIELNLSQVAHIYL